MEPSERGVDRRQLIELASEIFGPGAWVEERPSRELSSVDFMRFLVRIEREFGVTVPDDDLRAENFESLGSVLAMIGRNRPSAVNVQ